MDRINEFGLEPGVYAGEGKRIVLVNIVNEMDGQKLEDPLVCYRPLENVPRHIVTGMKMSEFKLKFRIAQ